MARSAWSKSGSCAGNRRPARPRSSEAASDRASSALPLRIVFSVPGGEYGVADHVELSGPGGKKLGVDNAGPLLVVKVPAGEYSVDVRSHGKSEHRPVRVGREPVTLNWRLPDDAPR